MASSDLLNTHILGNPRSDTEDLDDAGADQILDSGPDKRVTLPKPDTNNITVLTESLPNEPILPWHHFDSPWLEKEETANPEADDNGSVPPSTDNLGNETEEQLTLPWR